MTKEIAKIIVMGLIKNWKKMSNEAGIEIATIVQMEDKRLDK